MFIRTDEPGEGETKYKDMLYMDDIRTNVLYCGDNIDVMRSIHDSSVDLIYAYPPLFSDGFKGGIQVYVGWMNDVIHECYYLLKSTGSMYLHCDWHASHYLKVEMDKVFGYNMFMDEIICKYPGGSKRHDSILVYSKNVDHTFNCDVPVVELTFDNWRELLLDQIVKVSSNVFDVVLDPFCGDGSMLVSANNLGRKWIGIDKSSLYCMCAAKGFGMSNVDIIGMRMSMKDVLLMKPHVFQHWVCSRMEARDTNRHPGIPSGPDGGVDGYVLSNALTVGYEGVPIQIKQRSGVGVDDIKKFFGTMDNKNKKTGFFVAMSFGRGAVEQVAIYKRKGSADIVLVNVKDIINNGYFD